MIEKIENVYSKILKMGFNSSFFLLCSSDMNYEHISLRKDDELSGVFLSFRKF